MLAQAAGQLASNLDEVEHAHGVTDDDKSLFYKTPGLWQQKKETLAFNWSGAWKFLWNLHEKQL